MKSRLVAGALLASSFVFGHGDARAEDIDLFVQPAGAATGIPNVLLVLDNTANWGRTVDGQAIWINELQALLTTLTNLPVNDDGTAVVRVGVMMFTETGNPNNNIAGGYIRAAIRDMTRPTRPCTWPCSPATTSTPTSPTTARQASPWRRPGGTSTARRRTRATARSRPTT